MGGVVFEASEVSGEGEGLVMAERVFHKADQLKDGQGCSILHYKALLLFESQPSD